MCHPSISIRAPLMSLLSLRSTLWAQSLSPSLSRAVTASAAMTRHPLSPGTGCAWGNQKVGQNVGTRALINSPVRTAEFKHFGVILADRKSLLGGRE